ncbi:hypothetical protein QUB63_21690 [Microcoleus sp. ARI1-B5]|uniref:hypothetical protein n=1 Tax=unclassified Microcoleus TaxID=2642155 RepID=UPI002FD79F0E
MYNKHKLKTFFWGNGRSTFGKRTIDFSGNGRSTFWETIDRPSFFLSCDRFF